MSQDRRPRRLAVVAGMATNTDNRPLPVVAAVPEQTASQAKRARPALMSLIFIAGCAGGGGLGAVLLNNGFTR